MRSFYFLYYSLQEKAKHWLKAVNKNLPTSQIGCPSYHKSFFFNIEVGVNRQSKIPNSQCIYLTTFSDISGHLVPCTFHPTIPLNVLNLFLIDICNT